LNTYVDASVLLRIVFGEQGRLDSWAKAAPTSSELLRVECLRVVDRTKVNQLLTEEQVAQIRAHVLDAVNRFRLVPVTAEILERAGDPFPTSLGTLDAIHLSTALHLREDVPDLKFATHDQELALAARSVGFEVVGA
jgi:predicted nucleic acid-binding protein